MTISTCAECFSATMINMIFFNESFFFFFLVMIPTEMRRQIRLLFLNMETNDVLKRPIMVGITYLISKILFSNVLVMCHKLLLHKLLHSRGAGPSSPNASCYQFTSQKLNKISISDTSTGNINSNCFPAPLTTPYWSNWLSRL